MKFLFLVLLTFLSSNTWGACQVLSSQGQIVQQNSDAHFILLSSAWACPLNVIQYKELLSSKRLLTKASLVANRGRNNPAFGSFSFFEQVQGDLNISGRLLKILPGEFFFGHFTKKASQQIDLDQDQRKGQLLVELISWDYRKKLFNFYELIGTGGGAQWFYRGDSQDILSDNQLLYRSTSPQFGKTLRCSGCHSSGGPIMKELAMPHNDWWTSERPLDFGTSKPSPLVTSWLKNLQPASSFSASVQKGILKLQLSSSYQNLKSRQSLQEQLRPLFCDIEINLVSSPTLSSHNSALFKVPSSAFLNPFFGSSEITFSKDGYRSLAAKYRLHFPENNQPDADHIWLAPVKSYSDLISLQILLKRKLIDSEFLYDVLAVDAKNSLLSAQRCELLKLVPSSFSISWKNQLLLNLQKSSLPAAKVLFTNIMDPRRNKDWYIKTSQQYLQQLQAEGLSEFLFQKLLIDRQSVFDSVISKNPMGQILEPGFRVIFPVAQQ